MLRTRLCGLVLSLTLLSASSIPASSRDEYVSPAIAKERREYVSGAIEELKDRAETLRKVIGHKQAILELLRQVPAEYSGRAGDATALIDEAEEEISLALTSLRNARDVLKHNRFDAAERCLSSALKNLSRARELLGGKI